MRVRNLGVRHWVTRRGGVGVALTLEGVAPLTQGICSQLLRVLYFLALDGIGGHGLTELEDEGIQVRRPWWSKGNTNRDGQGEGARFKSYFFARWLALGALVRRKGAG
jgi:hypothetical protein